MLTLKHFLDRPKWAAAAGYEFNYIDCMAFTAARYDTFFSLFLDVIYEFPSTEVSELPLWLARFIATVAGIVIWPFIFSIIAFPVWMSCRKYRKKYHFGTGMNDIARKNLSNWLSECNCKWSSSNG